MFASWIFFVLSYGSAAAESKGDVCFASTWEAKIKSLFEDANNWFDNKIPKANDIVILSGGDVRVTKKAIGGHFELNSGMLNIDGGGLFVNGGLSCVGEECDSKKHTDYKLLFDRSKRKTCPLPKTTTPKPTKPKTEPTKPKPTKPKPTEPTKPKPTEPTKPKPTEPTKPKTEPTKPKPTEPTKPKTEPTKPKPTKPKTTTTQTTTTQTTTTSTSTTSTSTTSTSTPSWKRTSATIKPWRACEKAKSTKLGSNLFELKNGAALGKGYGTNWISLQKDCKLPASGTAAVTISTVAGTTYEVEFDSAVTAHDLDGFKNDFSTGLVVVDGRAQRPYYFHTSGTLNSKTQKWQRIKMHFVASKDKATLKFSEDPKNCIAIQNVQVHACKELSSGCSKTCQGNTCDYWGAEEDYTCAILEADYGCNCAGCKCAVDEMVCQKDKCLGKSCEEWVKAGISCETLKVSQGCTCTACRCGKGPRGSTTSTTSTTTSTDVKRTTTTSTTTSTTSTTVPGCTNKKACNYNPEASGDDGSCQMPKEFHDCKNKCLVKLDACGICGGKGVGADKSKCAAAQFLGDDYCDDGNNNCQCGWDKGDCCGKKNDLQYAYCKKCKCVDPTFNAPAPSVCKKPCGKKEWKGDNNCDDNNNFCGCDWDGGDCCGVKKNYKYCKKCKCLNPSFKAPAPSSDGCSDSCKKACAKPSYKGDGYCDDDNNHCGCDWDAGDCCGSNNFNYCSECKCLDCKYKGKSDKCKSDIKGVCNKPGWKGDNNCDDMNNNAGCNWDGGDCCGNKNYNYCSKCQCLDCTFKGKGDECISVSKGGCGAKNYKGDKFCDDNNNNAGCDWDGGDCCGTSNNYKYCKKCACRDCTYKPPTDKCTSKIKGSCKKPNWKGDKNCDDMNNNAGCNWDGGDCCGPNNNYGYCSKCQCLDCTYKGKGDGCVDVIQKGCGAPNFKGDGFCDDNNNVAGCSWDGGDCCGVQRNIKYCKKCLCLDCKAGGDGCVPSIKGGCAKPVWKGDQNCDDENNNAGCAWDGGDCCGKANNYEYCKACKCLDCKHESCKGSKVCKRPVWKGDGNCDDENNVCGCNWDGGDCCGPNVKKPYCKECKCLDPVLKDLKCDGSCKAPKFSSDAFCDDANNNCGCNWDGGACCGPKTKKDYCKECKCLDPKA